MYDTRDAGGLHSKRLCVLSQNVYFSVCISDVVCTQVRQSAAQSSSDPLSAFMSDLGACWPLAQHYREKRVKYYGSEGALFTVGAPAGAATAAGEVAGKPAIIPCVAQSFSTGGLVVNLRF